MSEELLTQEELADILHVSPNTVACWRKRGNGPPYYKLGGRTIRYPLTEAKAWFESRRVNPRRAPGETNKNLDGAQVASG